MHRCLTSLIVALGLLGATSAQAQDNPLSGQEGPVQGLQQSDLDAAVSARHSCQALIRLLNNLGGQWQLMRENARESAEYLADFQDARTEWDIRWGACAGARRDLDEGMPRTVLDYEAGLLKRLWLAISSISEALQDGRPRTEINKTASVYERGLAKWVAELPVLGAFWNGEYLAQSPGNDSCVASLERAMQNVAVQVMGDAGRTTEPLGAEALDALRSSLSKAEQMRRECKHQDPLQELELQLMNRSLRSYRQAISGLAEGSDAALREAMITVQEITSRLERCRQEHRSGTTVSDSCTAN